MQRVAEVGRAGTAAAAAGTGERRFPAARRASTNVLRFGTRVALLPPRLRSVSRVDGGRGRVMKRNLGEDYLRDYAPLLGNSPAMRAIRDRIERIADTDATVLIRGESGVGKEIVAKAIHEASVRRGAPCVKVNCAALPAELLESELFGHEKGAFTGAHR